MSIRVRRTVGDLRRALDDLDIDHAEVRLVDEDDDFIGVAIESRRVQSSEENADALNRLKAGDAVVILR